LTLVNSSIRHEVRTPLNHILGYCELLLEEAGERSLHQWAPLLVQIHSAGTRLLILSENLFGAAGTDPDPPDPGRFIEEWQRLLDTILDTTQSILDQLPSQGIQPLVEDIERIRTATRRLQRFLPARLQPGDSANSQTVHAGVSIAVHRQNPSGGEPAAVPAGLTGAEGVSPVGLTVCSSG